jgi:hypothetical protein
MLAELILSFLVLLTVFLLLIISILWDKMETFFHKKYTYFNIFFVAIYFLEQAVFIVTSYVYSQHINLLVGFFALVVLSTVALQGVMMESKSKKANEKLEQYTKSHSEKMSNIRREYESRIDKIRDHIHELETDNILLSEMIGNSKRLKK